MEAQYQYLVELTRHNILLHLKRNHCWDHCSPSTLQLYIKQYYDLVLQKYKKIPYDHNLLISQKSTVNRLSRISLSELDIKVSGRRGAVEISVSSRFRCPYGIFICDDRNMQTYIHCIFVFFLIFFNGIAGEIFSNFRNLYLPF